ncbi:hypothetical protein DFP72DRAFT_845780 [Ephemerocybe angulata]|uniref:Uncharacterized protein n=1 Tax=Ephemerocybe angulata TaxID=980116 RepID=A0A8H6I1S3_9AGAR|nr:hypothetical protein DFP72DRAFT_845780 [Tulosesus angulatus]
MALDLLDDTDKLVKRIRRYDILRGDDPGLEEDHWDDFSASTARATRIRTYATYKCKNSGAEEIEDQAYKGRNGRSVGWSVESNERERESEATESQTREEVRPASRRVVQRAREGHIQNGDRERMEGGFVREWILDSGDSASFDEAAAETGLRYSPLTTPQRVHGVDDLHEGLVKIQGFVQRNIRVQLVHEPELLDSEGELGELTPSGEPKLSIFKA